MIMFILQVLGPFLLLQTHVPLKTLHAIFLLKNLNEIDRGVIFLSQFLL